MRNTALAVASMISLLTPPLLAQQLTLRLTHDGTGPVGPGDVVTYTLTAEFDPEFFALETLNFRLVADNPQLVTLTPAYSPFAGVHFGSSGAGGFDETVLRNPGFVSWQLPYVVDNPAILARFKVSASCDTGTLTYQLRRGLPDTPFCTLARNAFSSQSVSLEDTRFECQPLEIADRAPGDQLLALVPFGYGGAADVELTNGGSDIPDLVFTGDGDLVLREQYYENGSRTSRLLRWDGAHWSQIQFPFPGRTIGFIKALGNGDLVAGGSMPGGLQRWDGEAWSQVGPPLTGSVYDAKLLENGDLVVVGYGLGSLGEWGNAAVRENGIWKPLGDPLDDWVSDVEQLPDGSVVIAGWFRIDGVIPRVAVLRDGVWQPLGSGLQGQVRGLTRDAAGLLLFVDARSIWKFDGSRWAQLPVEFDDRLGLELISDVATLPDGSLLVVGAMGSANGRSSPFAVRIRDDHVDATSIRLDGAPRDPSGLQYVPEISAVAVSPEGLPVLATTIRRAFNYRIDRLMQLVDVADPCCLSLDYQPNGIIDNGDIQAFIDAFLNADSRADANRDGVMDLGDVQVVVRGLLSGC